MRLLPHTLPRRNSRRHLLDEAPNPGPSALKRCWVIVPGRKMMFDPAGRDVVVKMKRGQVAAATPGNRAARGERTGPGADKTEKSPSTRASPSQLWHPRPYQVAGSHHPRQDSAVTNTTNPEFESFVLSRIPMLEHDLAVHERGEEACPPAVWKRRKDGIRYGLFYQVEHLLHDLRVYASEAALDYAADHWQGGSESLWTTTRDGQAKQERDKKRRKISKSGLIWEHTYTGEMLFADLLELYREGGGRLDPARLQALILDNLACAWLTREENSRLNKSNYKSHRGRGLGDALEAYRKTGIRLRPRPTRLDCEG